MDERPVEGTKHCVHWNNSVLCVVDCETTGLNYEEHDIWDICVLPLDSFYKPMRQFLPFNIPIKPRFPENTVEEAVRLHKSAYLNALTNGFDYDKSAEYFVEWFERLRMPPRKGILVLGQNWPFDRDFIRDWLGPKTFEYCFDGRFRDLMSTVNFINDYMDFKNEPIPFPSLSLKNICTRLGIAHNRAHLALEDCLVTAQAYGKLVRMLV